MQTEVIVSCAFKEAFVKAVTRPQLMSAARSLLSQEEAKDLRKAEKTEAADTVGPGIS